MKIIVYQGVFVLIINEGGNFVVFFSSTDFMSTKISIETIQVITQISTETIFINYKIICISYKEETYLTISLKMC